MVQFKRLAVESYFVHGNCLFMKTGKEEAMCVKNDGENLAVPFCGTCSVEPITEGLGIIQNYLAIEDRKKWFERQFNNA